MKPRTLLSLCAAMIALGGMAHADVMTTDADFAYIMDADTGTTLYSKNGETPMVPASMTKLMTVHIVLERIRDGRLSLDDEFTVSENAWRKGGSSSGGSTMFLEPRSKVRIEDLLRGVIIQSGNDACITIAEGISGSEEAFADLMTQRAHELGLATASFKNSTGLYVEDHVISAMDLARLARMTINDFPEFYSLYSETDFTWNGIKQPNRNPLLGEVEGADGLKTGHLDISGYGLVGSAVRDGERRIIVLNGLNSISERASEAQRVMRAAFVDFRTFTFADAGAVVGQADVWMGEQDKVDLTVDETLTGIVHLDSARQVRIFVEYKGPLHAPVAAGQVVGDLVVEAPGLDTIRVPLKAKDAVAKKGLVARALVGLGLGG